MKDARHPSPAGTPAIGIDAKVAFLERPEAYPEATEWVEVVETHMSWVFLTERFAYKLKKPVRYEFLDFRTLGARHRNCKIEVRLNRRLAPTVYLGAVPLAMDQEGRLSLGGAGEPVDWLVKMHRLSRDQMLDQAIERRAVDIVRVRNVARYLAAFYRDAKPIAMSAKVYRKRMTAEIDANRYHLTQPQYRLPVDLIEKACSAQSRFLGAHPDLFERRVIEAHGDLRPEHICLSEPPQIIDCLEFKRDFRILDPVDELSFLALECERLGAPDIGPVIFDTYRAVTGDTWPENLVFFYKSLRGCLRAKIAAWHLREAKVRQPAKWTGRARTYLALGEAYAEKLD